MTHSARLLLALLVLGLGAAACGTTPCEDYCDRALTCGQDAGVNATITQDATDECIKSCEGPGAPSDTVLKCYVDAVDKGTCTDGLDCFEPVQ